MDVRELIETLQKLDPSLIVSISSHNTGIIEDVTSVEEFDGYGKFDKRIVINAD